MSTEKWQDPANRFIAYLLRGAAADPPDDDVLVVLNAGPRRPGSSRPERPASGSGCCWTPASPTAGRRH